jgi:hypothetical protein
MSSKATTWAWEQRHIRGAQKLLLLALADCCNAWTGLAFPSVEQLIDMTGQDRKTILANLRRLEDAGVMTDTGKKTGRTQQIIVWRMAVPKDPKNGTVKQSQKRMANGPKIPSKQSQNWDTEPSKEPNKGTDSNHYDDNSRETDLFGEPIKSPEEVAAERRADVISKIEEGWAALVENAPNVAPLRGGKLDDTRAEAALARAAKFAGEDETEADVWAAIFEQIQSSHWLCGETRPRDDRGPFKLQMTWLLENRNFTKVLEGKFSDGRSNGGTARAGDANNGTGPQRYSPGGSVASRIIERNLARGQRSARG